MYRKFFSIFFFVLVLVEAGGGLTAQTADLPGAAPFTSSLQAGSNPKISPNQAQIAALTANPGAVALDVELENYAGQLVYSVSLNTRAEVKIDAGNGKVLYTEVKTGSLDNEDQEDPQDGGQEHFQWPKKQGRGS